MSGVFYVSTLASLGGEVGASLEFALGGGWVFWALLAFLPPLLAMRLVSEEARSGTLEFLLTAPVTDFSVVVGKFLAATSFMAVLWLAVPIYGLAIASAGVAPDWGALIIAWVGAVLSSGLFVSISLLVNAFTSTPLLGAFLAFVANLWWLLLPVIATGLMTELKGLLAGVIGDLDQAERWIRGALSTMDVLAHTQVSFLRGVLDTSEVVFFLTWTGLFLFLTVRALGTRRWRG
jgi:ABC-2 type transport system permease protein